MDGYIGFRSFICLLVVIGSIHQASGVIYFFRHCDEEILIQDTVLQQISVSGSDWKTASYACLVTFRSSDQFDLIYYQFNTFDVNNRGLDVSILTSKERSEGFINQGVYSRNNSPQLSQVKTGARFLQLQVTRGKTESYDFMVSMTLFTKAGVHNGPGLKTGQIVGIVVGVVVFLIALGTLIVCCAIGAKYPDRRGSIYTVARRLSIFASPTSGSGPDTDHSDTESEGKPATHTAAKSGQTNEGYVMNELSENRDETYTSRTGQPVSDVPNVPSAEHLSKDNE